MIILSGVLVVVAIALLVAGIVAGNGDSAQVFGLDALVVIYISIAVSIISALCLAIGVFLRRKELWGSGASAAPARQSKKAKKDRRKKPAPPVPAPAKSAVGAAGAPAAASPAPSSDASDDVPEVAAPPADVPEDALVFVVRGRKRYHLDTCRQLAGRDVEELTYAEAKEEGFSPCTACMPDTALAARAAASVPASPAKDGGPGGKAGAAGREPGAERSEGGLAGLAKPAPSAAASTAFDTPVSFADPGAPDKPGSFDKPGAFDRTAEIPRADESAAEPPAGSPAGPTLTDMPAAGLFAAAAKAPSAPETAEKGEPASQEPEARSGWERPAEPASASPDVTVDLGSAPFTGADAAAPKPRHADDETADEPAAGDVFAADPEPEPAAVGEPSDADESSGEPAGEGPQVRILSGTKRYHRVDCALIEDVGDDADDLESLSRAEAKSRGCTPCLVCQPDRAAHARD
ncbi:hypothetical protein HUT06_15840 [Actinomadura sp. NAK00032]|uniref:hypothetical protein n=1 Tax=Actinomadura sp. NAK00032 TaxID=2742128 RepID=UPI0015917B7E|nr:hypothetical protein [Actinomadura sp. NAK00032]QKW35326.1 hypothetical protein HUT06_15840 [Actinomadura sp. NAK00032]